MAIEQRKVTLEEFLRWPEQEPPLEYFDGVVSKKKMSASLPHGLVQTALIELVNVFARPRRIGLMLSETRARLDGGSPVPDLSFYDWTKIPRDPNGRPPTYATESPNLVVEIASLGQTRAMLEERCRWFVEHGVPLALLIWPVDETVTVFRTGAKVEFLRGPDRIPLGELLAILELTVQELFDTAYGR